MGREILLGALLGVASAVLGHPQPLVESALGRAPIRPLGLVTTYAVDGFQGTLASILYHVSQALPSALIILSLFFPLKLLPKKDWLAALLMSLLFCIRKPCGAEPVDRRFVHSAVFLAYLYILYRFGLVALTVLYFIDQVADGMPIARPLNAWYTQGGLIAIVVIVTVAFYGFYVSCAGKPLLGCGELKI